MLQVTIQDTVTNEVIYDREVSVIALQAVDRTNLIVLRHMTDDSEPGDVLRCLNATLRAAEESKNLLTNAVNKVLGGVYTDEDDE